MKLMSYLLGIDTKLALGELAAVFETFSMNFNMLMHDGQIAVFEANDAEIKKIGKRLALTHSIYLFIGMNKRKYIESFFENKTIKLDMPFRVRLYFIGEKSPPNAQDLEKNIGKSIWKRSEEMGITPSVDLNDPKTEICIFIEKENAYIGRKLIDIDKRQFRMTEPERRPFVRPITMGSRTARVMVNLARLKKGKVLDPFCGTGAILIEAGIVGLEAYGIDIKGDLIEGAGKNAAHYGINGHFSVGDARHLEAIFPENYFDAIVTDLPYGISASTGKEIKEQLYSDAIFPIEKVLKDGGFCVIAAPGEMHLKTKMKLIEIHNEQLSTNLVRHIHVYQKINS
ncbi:MAG: methyltransferase domain-containing protein [Candidatus Micrarchaeota archaeon]|nr:methyltransferase domain-containing protein [Candidatus Micrarchaeota archaeon]